MCTVIILRRNNHNWPVLIGANRDELAERPWMPPARHWPDRPEVVAGLDTQADGTWLGINEAGVVAAVLNRARSLGPAPGKRSRGELPLEALDHADAAAAVEALTHINGSAYRPFNLLVLDNRDAFWIRHEGGERVGVEAIPEGYSLFTAHDRNDTEACERARTVLPRLQAAPVPAPDTGDWAGWVELLASPDMALAGPGSFGTVSASLIALPAVARRHTKPVFLFAGGKPGVVPFTPVAM